MKYFILTIQNGKVVQNCPLKLDAYRMLLGNRSLISVQSLSNPEQKNYFGFSSPSVQGSLRVSGLGDVSFDEQLKRASALESLILTTGAFTDQDSAYFFAQTHYDLKFYIQGKKQTTSTSLNRYSYIPSMIANRSLFPTIQRVDTHLNPAMYIPATMITGLVSEIIYADLHDGAKLKRPTRLKFKLLDPNCVGLGNLIPATQSLPAYQVFFCGNQRILTPIQ